MFDYIEKLRQKPEHIKKQIAFLISLLFAGIIFIVWLTVIMPGFEQQKQIDDRVAKSEPSPFSTFIGMLSSGTSAMSDQVSKIKELSSSLFGGVEYIATTSPSNEIEASSTDETATTTNQ